MKKKLFSFIASMVIVLSLSSCSIVNNKKSVISKKPWLEGKTVKGHNFTYDITLTDYDELKGEMDKAKEYALEDSHYDYFYDVYIKVQDFYYEVDDANLIEDLEYSIYGKDENLTKSENFYNISTEILEWFNDVEHIAFNNSYKEKLWENKTDEEILDIIGKDLPDEYFELSRNLKSLENSFLELDESDDNFKSDVDDIFVQYVSSGNEFAKLSEYDNYLEYLYKEEYERDYSVKDTEDFYEYTEKYIVPYLISLKEKRDNLKNVLTKEEKSIVSNFFGGDSFKEERFSYIEQYKDYMGGIIKEAFDNLFKEDGCYFISYEDDSLDGAYQNSINNTPYVFYGSGYHDSLTIVHEFGHYTDDLLGTSKVNAYDLLETHSQANELLFLDYYRSINNYRKEVNDYIYYYGIYDKLLTVFISSFVNEVEKRCYESTDLKKGDLIKEIEKMYSENDNLSKAYPLSRMISYVVYVTMYSPGYYISYATSSLGSCYIEKIANDNFDAGKEMFYKLFKYENCDTYREVYEYAGVKDPFEEELFQVVAS